MKAMTLVIGILAVSSYAMADLKSEINAANKQMSHAMVKNDFKLFAKLTKEGCTKDFKYIEGGQTMNYDQMLEMMKQSFGSSTMGKVTKAQTKLVSATEKGKNGNAKLIYTLEMSSVDEKKKTHITKMVGNVHSTYRKEGGKWKLAVMDWKDTKMTVDGKAVNMAATAPAGGGK